MFNFIWNFLRRLIFKDNNEVIDSSKEEEKPIVITTDASVQATAPPPDAELELILKTIKDQRDITERKYNVIMTMQRESINKENEVVANIASKLDYYVQKLNNTTLRKDADGSQHQACRSEATINYKASLEELEQKLSNLQILTKKSNYYINSHRTTTFNGYSGFTEFKYRFEAAAERNKWSDETSLLTLVMLLRPPALGKEVLHSVLNALEIHYGDKYKEYAAQLKTRKQRPDEELKDWAIEIDELVRLAFPWATTTLDDVVITAFIEGLRDARVRTEVVLGHHKTLEDALAHAEKVNLRFVINELFNPNTVIYPAVFNFSAMKE